jgi:hypothetical protein
MVVAAGRCRFPWSHQYFLRLDDWRVECVHCHRIKREPGRVHRAGHIPSSSELDYIHPRSNMTRFLSIAARVSKAIAAAVAAGVAAFSAAEVAGTVGLGEWLTVLVAIVGAFLVAYNAPANT